MAIKHVSDLINAIEAEVGQEKLASVEDTTGDPMVKFAEDVFATGRLFAKGFVAELQKFAAEGGKVEPSTGNPANDDSVWKRVAKKVQSRHGAGPAASTIASSGTGGVGTKKIEGENPGVVAESVAPKTKAPQTHETHGNVGG